LFHDAGNFVLAFKAVHYAQLEADCLVIALSN